MIEFTATEFNAELNLIAFRYPVTNLLDTIFKIMWISCDTKFNFFKLNYFLVFFCFFLSCFLPFRVSSFKLDCQLSELERKRGEKKCALRER